MPSAPETTAAVKILSNGVALSLNRALRDAGVAAVSDCVLLLTGTSMQVEDVVYFTDFLQQQGHAVATLERFVGGPFDIGYDPKQDRVDSLEAALSFLLETHMVAKIHLVAHSYASFEAVRVLSRDPARYAGRIHNIVLINPAGFSKKTRFFRHCLRFTFLMVLRECWGSARQLMCVRREQSESSALLVRKLHATCVMFRKTVSNPSKTIKEVADVVSFKVKPHLKQLIQDHHYRFHVFINMDDNLVAPDETLRELQDLLPASSMMTCSGHHMDLFVDSSQMILFNAFLTDIMEQKC